MAAAAVAYDLVGVGAVDGADAEGGSREESRSPGYPGAAGQGGEQNALGTAYRSVDVGGMVLAEMGD